MLCQQCQKMLQGEAAIFLPFCQSNAGKPLYYHHIFPYMIELAAKDGCQICKILWDRLSDAEKELIQRTRKQRIPLHPFAGFRSFTQRDLSFYGWTIAKDDPTMACLVKFQFGSACSKIVDVFFVPAKYAFAAHRNTMKFLSIEELAGDRPVTDRMDSASNWELIQSWANLCSPTNRDHNTCYLDSRLATSEVPSRLLDIAAGESGQEIRLSLSPEDRVQLPYVTISYTWGPEPDLDRLPLLRKENIETFARGIPLSTLPRLFRDTVEAARRLHYRYLWIDAFCIIQDDEDDWQRQTAVMGQIYRYAVLNIAAGGAKNSHSPLLGERDTSLVRPCRVELNWREISSYYRRREVRGCFFVVGKDFLRENLMQTPLNRRAWVMQERVLSRRLLHFGKHQLFWRCMDDTACETFPNGIRKAASKEAFERSTMGLDHQYFENDTSMWDSWLEFVEMYSTCAITRDSDKLIALSGVTRMFGEKVRQKDDIYLAGLWQRTLLTDLLWLVADGKKGDGSPCQRSPGYGSADYVAPSWSWASVRGRVTHKLRHYRASESYHIYYPCIDILKTHVLPVDARNPYGSVRECHIRLRGTLLSGRGVYWSRYWIFETQSEKNFQILFAFTGLFRNIVVCTIDDMDDFKPRLTFPLPIPGLLKAPDIDFLPLIWRSDPEYSEDRRIFKIPNVEGLLVTRIPDTDTEYKRVGYFRSLMQGKDVSAFLRHQPSDILLV